jgi:integrase
MSRQLNRLSARRAATLSTPGRHADGGGLYLVVDPSGAKRWAFMSWRGGRQVELGLGGTTYVSLVQARQRAADMRRMIGEGRDPLQERLRQKRIPTFGELADEVVESLEAGWRNVKHREQWRMTLTKYAAPLRAMPVDRIETHDVLDVLRPLWTSKPETGARLRGRIEKVLDAARAKGFRSGENPARWRGHLENLLPRRQKLTRGHHKAMPYGAVPTFLSRLREQESVSRLALEYCILTCARSGEVFHATWDEIDYVSRTWTVPAHRMKAGRTHRVPLGSRAIAILRKMQDLRQNNFVFPGQRMGRPLSNMAMAEVLKRLDTGGATVHGFRSSFRDWAGERTNFPREIAERMLAHTIGNDVERAYRRGDALERRRELIEEWERYCLPLRETPTGHGLDVRTSL